ncbi:hypothetical protein F3G64_34760, partial [Pseudomonas aeruginosa]
LASMNKTANLFWIKAHAGIPGNERADELAKKAALTNKQAPKYDGVPLSYVRHTLRQTTIDKWQQRYTEATTGMTTKMFFVDVRRAHKILSKMKVNNIIAQLLTGHG